MTGYKQKSIEELLNNPVKEVYIGNTWHTYSVSMDQLTKEGVEQTKSHRYLGMSKIYRINGGDPQKDEQSKLYFA